MSRPLDFLNKFPHPSEKTLLLIAITAVATLLVSATTSLLLKRYHNLDFPSIGTIQAIGIKAYWDADLQEEVKEIDWGTIYSGSLESISLYVQSMSNVNITLELVTANWTFLDSENMTVSGPSNSTSYMNLTWDYSNRLVGPDEIVQVTLTLLADDSLDFIQFMVSNDVTKFTFDIIIRPSV